MHLNQRLVSRANPEKPSPTKIGLAAATTGIALPLLAALALSHGDVMEKLANWIAPSDTPSEVEKED